MELFVPDNHATNSAELFPVSERILTTLDTLLKQAYPELFQSLEALSIVSIGNVNINSSNFCVQQNYYLKLIACDKLNTPVSLFPKYAGQLRKFGFVAPDFFPVNGNTLFEGIGISGPILLDQVGHPKAYYFFLQEFVSASFYSGSKGETAKAIELISAMEGVFQPDNGWMEPLIPAHLSPYNNFHPEDQWVNLRERFISDNHQQSPHFQSVANLLPTIVDGAIQTVQKDFSAQFQTSAYSLVHIDLHPHNILVNKEQELVVIDYESFRYMPVVVYRGFSMFKLIRKSVSSGNVTLEEARKLIENTFSSFEREEALAGAEGELLRRIMVILDLHYHHNDTRWDFDLVKHSRGILESRALLG